LAVSNADPGEGFERECPFLLGEHAQHATPPGCPVQQTDQHVHQHGQSIHQVELLEDEPDLRSHPADVAMDASLTLNAAAVDLDQGIAAAVRRHQSGNVSQQRGFARAGSADQRDHLSLLDHEVDVAQRMPAGLEMLVELLNAERIRHLKLPVSPHRGV
jgi:hypothetical protein